MVQATGGRADLLALRALATPAGSGDGAAQARADGGRSRAATAAVLATLGPEGFEVVGCDDEHLAVGATGAWLVACRDFAYPLSLGRRGELWTGCYPVSGLLDGLAQRAEEIGAALGAELTPVLAVYRATVPDRHLRHAGVHVVGAGRSLIRLLTSAPTRLGEDEARQVADLAQELRPRPQPRHH